MYQKIKESTQKFWTTAIIVIVAIFIAGTTNAQSKQSDIVGVWKGRYSSSGEVTLTINVDMTGFFEFVNAGKSGSYKVSVEYSNGRYNVIGKEWINRPSNFVFVNLNRGVIKNGVFSGTDFQLERVATAQQLQEQQAERERQLQIQKEEREKQLQARKAKQERDTLLTIIGFGAFIILMIVIAIRNQQKAKERKIEYQPIFSDIFKKRGFSATDIIWTNCRQIIRKNANDYMIHNIVFGVKNGMVSFFGGGSQRVNFGVEDEKVAFYSIRIPKWKKLLKETEDILLSNGFVAKILFPKKDEIKFKHLVDVPIYAIEAVEGKEIGNRTELFIEYSSDNLIKFSPYCSNTNYAIETVNAITDVLDTILDGDLSNSKIYRTNLAINEASAKDGEMTRNKQNQQNKQAAGCIGGLFLLILSIVTLGAIGGARNWSNDR